MCHLTHPRATHSRLILFFFYLALGKSLFLSEGKSAFRKDCLKEATRSQLPLIDMFTACKSEVTKNQNNSFMKVLNVIWSREIAKNERPSEQRDRRQSNRVLNPTRGNHADATRRAGHRDADVSS